MRERLAAGGSPVALRSRDGAVGGFASQPAARPVGVAASGPGPCRPRLANRDVRCIRANSHRADVLDAFLAALPIDREFVLVAHSNAGAYVPALMMQRRIVAAVFVDAVLPPGSGRVPLAPPAFLDLLREKADGSGLLPVWTSWWDEAEVAALFPNAETRTRLEREQQRLPLSYFEGLLPVPEGWDDRPGAYLAFGDTYGRERDEAERRRWPVSTLPAKHLHLLNNPDQVATELVELMGKLGISALTR